MKETLAKGKFLISEPFLNDPNFKRTIILLAEHNDQGSLGFVLNRPTGYKLKDLLPDFPEFETIVYYGGPVQANTLQFIHKSAVAIEGSIEVADGLFWGGNFDILKLLIESGSVNSDDFRFFIGYSGWGEGQLEDELGINSWLVSSATIEQIFSEDPDTLWRNVLKKLGKKFAILASFPENPSVN